MKGRTISGLAGLVIAIAVLGGCSSGSGEQGSESGNGALTQRAPAMDAPAKADGQAAQDAQQPAPAQPPAAQSGGSQAQSSGGQAKPGAPQAQVAQPGLDRKLVRTATLELAARDVVGVANRARDVAVALGGFTGQEEIRPDSATLTLLVPSDQFDKALGQLSGLVAPADLRSRSTSAQDVTEQLVDVQSRVTTQRASVERVRELLSKAQSVTDIVQIESEVTRREADLESLEQRRDALSGQVAMSTVALKISASGQPAPAEHKDSGGPGGILGALDGGWHALLGAGGAVLRVLAAMLPFLVVFGVPAAFAARWWRRRHQVANPAVPHEAGA